jgi:hypothetical protein
LASAETIVDARCSGYRASCSRLARPDSRIACLAALLFGRTWYHCYRGTAHDCCANHRIFHIHYAPPSSGAPLRRLTDWPSNELTLKKFATLGEVQINGSSGFVYDLKKYLRAMNSAMNRATDQRSIKLIATRYAHCDTACSVAMDGTREPTAAASASKTALYQSPTDEGNYLP